MANLTLTVDEALLRRARIRALEEGTSVNALVRRWLESYAGEDPAMRAMHAFLAMTADTAASSADRRWSREELYDR